MKICDRKGQLIHPNIYISVTKPKGCSRHLFSATDQVIFLQVNMPQKDKKAKYYKSIENARDFKTKIHVTKLSKKKPLPDRYRVTYLLNFF